MWLTTLQLGARNLLLHKLRTSLTMLGTVLGVSSVIAMLAVGEGSKKEAIEQIKQLGAANVIIRSVQPKNEDEQQQSSNESQNSSNIQVVEYGLRYNDLDRLQVALPNVKRAVPIALVRQDANHGRHRINNARVLGTTPQYLDVKNLIMQRGRFLSETDLKITANVVVLAAGAAKQLFSFQDPLDKTLLLASGAYRVIGVLDTQDSGSASPGAIGHQNFNNDIYIPITAAQRRVGELQRISDRKFEKVELSEITLTVDDERFVSQTALMARKLMLQRDEKRSDIEIQVPLELLKQAEREKRIWNLVLGSIASISLLVGGIGIMNIMLATVTERTREIGVRRALGAKRRDITAQFLVETTVISTTGGLLGIFLGALIPKIISIALDVETALSLWSIVLAFGISVAIGIIFGVYPARRAAMMDPIEALRHQ